MGVAVPLTRKQLIEQHISSMKLFYVELAKPLPLVSRKRILKRLDKCIREMERAHKFICDRERALDR
jgi:hypothetical protein